MVSLCQQQNNQTGLYIPFFASHLVTNKRIRITQEIVVSSILSWPFIFEQMLDTVEAIIFLASELGNFITGEDWYIDGGET